MVSVAVISEVLKGLDFPATKQQCVDYAKKRDAPKEVIQALERISGDRFESMSSVWKAIGEEHKRGEMPGLSRNKDSVPSTGKPMAGTKG